MIPPEIYTGIAVFLGGISSGLIVVEYSLWRGRNMISKGLINAIKQIPFDKIMAMTGMLKDKEPKRKPDDYD